MTEFVYKTLEKLVNAYLGLDPEILARLSHFQGKTAQLSLTDLKLNFFIRIDETALNLSSRAQTAPSTTIEGSCFDLLKMLSAQGNQAKFISSHIKISGDLDFGQSLYKILREIDIDWEEHLSKLVGDTIAHQLMQHTRGAFSWLKKSLGTLRENTQEFIQEEARYSPSRDEVEDFYEEVAVLRNDTERLEQKMLLLLNRKENV